MGSQSHLQLAGGPTRPADRSCARRERRSAVFRRWPTGPPRAALTAYVTRGDRDAAAYVRGGVATGDFLPGLSDVDTAVVFARRAGPRAADARACRWRRLSARSRSPSSWSRRPMVFERRRPRRAGWRPRRSPSGLTAAVSRCQSRAGYFGAHASFDWLRMLERPGLYGLGADWRLLAGPERRPPLPASRIPRRGDRRLARVALFWWRWAIPGLRRSAAGPDRGALREAGRRAHPDLALAGPRRARPQDAWTYCARDCAGCPRRRDCCVSRWPSRIRCRTVRIPRWPRR